MKKFRVQTVALAISIFIALYIVYEISSSEVKHVNKELVELRKSDSLAKGTNLIDINTRMETNKSSRNNLLKYLEDEKLNTITRGQHILPNKSAPPLFTGHKIVHIDLKGAPLKVSYYKELFPLIKSLGATGLLVEYEDMFPYSITGIPALNAYSAEDITAILKAAAKNKLEVIPLVQTFGHLEFVLKLKEFEILREVPKFPQVICPSRNGTTDLVKVMIDDVVRMHPNIKYLHIGCDEVYNLGECSQCMDVMVKRGWTRRQLFLSHVTTVARYVREKFPWVRVLSWDDEFRQMSAQELSSAGLSSLLEPVVWKYTPTIDPYITDDVWDKYAAIFGSVWIASAFKGATGPDKITTDINYHLENHRAWMRVVARLQHRLLFKGIMMTGWQRYDHFAVLCELLPVGLPSLAVNLAYISQDDLSLQAVPREVQKLLGCGPEILLPKAIAYCHFPGAVVYTKAHVLSSLLDQVHEVFDMSEVRGWLTEYNIRTTFSNPAHVERATSEVDRLKMELMYLEQEMSQAMSDIFDNNTVREWIYTFISPVNSRLQDIWDAKERLLSVTSWPRRPLHIAERADREL